MGREKEYRREIKGDEMKGIGSWGDLVVEEGRRGSNSR